MKEQPTSRVENESPRAKIERMNAVISFRRWLLPVFLRPLSVNRNVSDVAVSNFVPNFNLKSKKLSLLKLQIKPLFDFDMVESHV